MRVAHDKRWKGGHSHVALTKAARSFSKRYEMLSLPELHSRSIAAYPVSRLPCMRKRDGMAAVLRSCRAWTQATGACLPSGFCGSVACGTLDDVARRQQFLARRRVHTLLGAREMAAARRARSRVNFTSRVDSRRCGRRGEEAAVAKRASRAKAIPIADWRSQRAQCLFCGMSETA